MNSVKISASAFVITCALVSAAWAGGWNGSERLERARSGLAAASAGDIIYVGGGAAAGDPANAFEMFDASKESWRPLPSLPVGLISFSMAAVGNEIFVAGGYSADDPGEPRKDVWAYDTQSSSWTQKPSMPAARAGHGMVGIGNKLYVVGGAGKDASRVFVFDTSENEWRSAAALPTARRALAVATDGKGIYAVGGIRPDGSVTGALEMLDVSSNKWSTLLAMPSARGALAAGIINGRLHVVGGATWKPLKTYASHDVFSLSSRTWDRQEALPSARQGMAAGVAAGRLWVFGGGSGAGVFGMFTASDAVDGYLARHFSHKSAIGAYLDPIADKILIVTLFGLLTVQGHLPLWLMILVVARDAAIVATVAAFNRMKGQPLRMKPLFVSKLTTFFQIMLLLATMADLAFALGLEGARLALAVAAAVFTLASWIAYYFEGQRTLRQSGTVPGG